MVNSWQQKKGEEHFFFVNQGMRAEAEGRWKESSKEEERKQERSRVYQEEGGSKGREGPKASHFGEVSEATLQANAQEGRHRMQLIGTIEGKGAVATDLPQRLGMEEVKVPARSTPKISGSENDIL